MNNLDCGLECSRKPHVATRAPGNPTGSSLENLPSVPSSSLWLKAASRRDATVSRQQPVLPASGGWGPSGLEEGVWAQHPEDALHTA